MDDDKLKEIASLFVSQTVKEAIQSNTPIKDEKVSKDKLASAGSSETKKLKKPGHKYNRSQEFNISTKKELDNFKELNSSEKMKKSYLKKYQLLANRVITLQRQDEDMKCKLSSMQRKNQEMESVKQSKQQFKSIVKEHKEQRNKQLSEKKNKIKSIRENQLKKQTALQEKYDEKKKIMCDIAKADQNLRKDLISQSISKTEAVNKCKYLKIKEYNEKRKLEQREKTYTMENQKNSKKKKEIDENLKEVDDLKMKCQELEKLEMKYLNELKSTKVKERVLKGNIEGPSTELKLNQSVQSNGKDFSKSALPINKIKVNGMLHSSSKKETISTSGQYVKPFKP